MSNPINYDPNTPVTNLSYADWQIQFAQNFQQYNIASGKNHLSVSGVTGTGNHTIVEMPEQDSDPQTGAVDFAIYTKNVDEQTDQLFFQYPGNTPVVQFTNYQIYSIVPRVAPNIAQTSFFTFLPGGLLILFGSFGPFTSSSTGSKTETDNTLFLYPPVVKNVASVNLCIQGTTPDYTPSATLAAVIFDPLKGLVIEESEIIKQIYISPHTGSKNTIIDYLVIANI